MNVTQLRALPTSIEAEADEAAEICRQALADPKFAGLNERLPSAPSDAEGWFELLRGFPLDPECFATILAMHAALPDDARAKGISVGHYAALRALPVSASRIVDEPLPDFIKRRYIALIRQVAERAKHWETHFDAAGPRFHDLAHLVTLRRFPAGDVGFQIQPRISWFYGLRVHPVDCFGYAREIAFALRGVGPLATLHLNYARENPLVMLQIDFERSLWRIAKALDHHPEVRGLVSSSWFHSAVVRDAFPHLGWMRETFLEGGAYAVDMEPGKPVDIGYNSAKRRKLHEEGKFCPRQTLVIWPRQEFLAWAGRRSDLAEPGEAPPVVPARATHRAHGRSPKPARAAKRNSPLTLWEGSTMYVRSGTQYSLFVIFLPAVVLAVVATVMLGWGAGLPAFVLGCVAAHAFQYFFFQ